MKKKPFVLLEVLIAFNLVLICAVPLVKQPLKLFKDEMVHLQEMEQQRLADWTFTEIKEMLLKNEIPWEKIPLRKARTGPFELPSMTIEIPGCKQKEIQRHFTLYTSGEILGKQGEVYRQLHICVHLNIKKYTFRLPVQKLLIE
jgi:hypothetical protein